MWIVDNSMDVMQKITNLKEPARNIRTYDFSTLYTSLPHRKLKEKLSWVISQCFNDGARKYIKINGNSAHWSKSRGNNNQCWDKDEPINHVNLCSMW